MFCKYCGAKIPDGTEICPKCYMNMDDNPFDNQHNLNTQQGYNPNMQQPPYNQNLYGQQPYLDNSPASAGMKALSFFVPVAGIILYFTDRDKKPQSAKDCLKFALIPLGISIALYIIAFIMMIIASSYGS